MQIGLHTIVAAVTAAALGSIFDTAHGAIVSVNFKGDDATGLSATDSTGVISAANYNNVSGSSGSSITLNDSTGVGSVSRYHFRIQASPR